MSKRNLKGAREKIARYICDEVVKPAGVKEWAQGRPATFDELSQEARKRFLRYADDIAGILQDEVKKVVARAGERN